MNEAYSSDGKKQGRWSKEEQNLFNFVFQWHRNDWKKLSEIITSRSIVQIRSHAQKYCNRFKKIESNDLQVQKVYIIDSSLEELNQYISSTCSDSFKKYLELRQDLMYSQVPQMECECKLPEHPIKYELNHN